MRTKVWIFGYGSLVWNPGFSFEESQIGYIRGWARRFYQGSTDHRGVPGSPGRVATLVADATATCWGVAYQVAGDSLESIFSYLDYREKGGFSRHHIDFYPRTDRTTHPQPISNTYVYVAQDDNPNYLGPAPILEMAQQIFLSTGPSGSNQEYLTRLAQRLRIMGVNDEHVFELEQHVHALGVSSEAKTA
jgi:cation transport regulator ChaC